MTGKLAPIAIGTVTAAAALTGGKIGPGKGSGYDWAMGELAFGLGVVGLVGGAPKTGAAALGLGSAILGVKALGWK